MPYLVKCSVCMKNVDVTSTDCKTWDGMAVHSKCGIKLLKQFSKDNNIRGSDKYA